MSRSTASETAHGGKRGMQLGLVLAGRLSNAVARCEHNPTCLPIYVELARSHRHQNRSGSRTSIRREFRVIQFFIQYLFPLKRPFTNRFKGGVTCKSSMKEIMHERESNNTKQTHAACCEAH